MTSFNNQSLKDQFYKLATPYSKNQVTAAELWIELEEAYSAKGRHYHNFEHLAFMLKNALKHRAEIDDFDTLAFSIFYHDVVYNPKKSNNEAKSAELMEQRLSVTSFPASKIQKCYSQILATKEHSSEIDKDTCFLLDLDLLILGESLERYKTYTANIRKEYAMYPDFMYKPARKKVLKHFLDMPKIFKTELFFKSYEAQARENLKWELG